MPQQLKRPTQNQLVAKLVPSEPKGGGCLGKGAAQKDTPSSESTFIQVPTGSESRGPEFVYPGFKGEIQKSGLIGSQLSVLRRGP